MNTDGPYFRNGTSDGLAESLAFLADGLDDVLAPVFGLLACFLIGICLVFSIFACHRRWCLEKDKKSIEGEYVKYGTYFDKAYNATIDENDSERQKTSNTQRNLEIEPSGIPGPSSSLPQRKPRSHDTDGHRQSVERSVTRFVFPTISSEDSPLTENQV